MTARHEAPLTHDGERREYIARNLGHVNAPGAHAACAAQHLYSVGQSGCTLAPAHEGPHAFSNRVRPYMTSVEVAA